MVVPFHSVFLHFCLLIFFYRLLSSLTGFTSKVLLKILQVRLQQYMNHELPDDQAEFRKGRGTRDQIASIHWIKRKSRSSRKASTSALLTMPKPLTVWTTTNYGKILKEMGIPDHLTCLLKKFPQFVVIHTVKGFGIVNKAEVDAFLELLAFLMTQQMLEIWSLFPLPFLNLT